MAELSISWIAVVTLALLLLARVVPLVALTPFGGGQWLPRPVQLALAVGLGVLVAPVALPPAYLASPPGGLELAALLVREVGIGLLLGFVTSLVFEAARMAGGIIDRAALDAHDEGPFSKLYLLGSVVMFFVVGGHRAWLAAIGLSYAMVPLDATVTSWDAISLLRAVADVFTVALLFALPVLATVLLLTVLVGVASRASELARGALSAPSTRLLVCVAVVALTFGIFTDRFASLALEAMQQLPAVIEDLDVR